MYTMYTIHLLFTLLNVLHFIWCMHFEKNVKRLRFNFDTIGNYYTKLMFKNEKFEESCYTMKYIRETGSENYAVRFINWK